MSSSGSAGASHAGDKTMHKVRGWLPTVISGMALLGSALSLWETTFKQAEMQLHVSDNIYYTRDPYGSFEVLIVPVTIANGGARDGTVLSLALDVKNSTNGQSKRFKSTYMAKAQYFGGRDDVNTNQRRPKLPFAPLSVAGHGAFTGTLLFYPADAPEKTVVDSDSKVEMTLTVELLSGTSWLDRLIAASPPPPATLEAEVSNYVVGVLISGYIMPLKVKLHAPSASAAQTLGDPAQTRTGPAVPTPSPTSGGRS